MKAAEKRPIERMLDALETHYAEGQADGSVRYRRYTDAQRQELIDRYDGYPEKFLLDVYDAITCVHEQRFRTLPDKAVFERAIGKLPPPSTYRDGSKLLPEPNLEAEIERERRRQMEELGKDPVNDAFGAERRRIRAKKHKTKYESWWLYCMERWGTYKAMPADWTEDSYDELMAKQEQSA